MGNPFINAVYSGHPGWKAMAAGSLIRSDRHHGGRVVVVRHNLGELWRWCLFVLIPSPILLYIGMLIGAQAFQTTPVKHAPAWCWPPEPPRIFAAWAKSGRSTPCSELP